MSSVKLGLVGQLEAPRAKKWNEFDFESWRFFFIKPRNFSSLSLGARKCLFYEGLNRVCRNPASQPPFTSFRTLPMSLVDLMRSKTIQTQLLDLKYFFRFHMQERIDKTRICEFTWNLLNVLHLTLEPQAGRCCVVLASNDIGTKSTLSCELISFVLYSTTQIKQFLTPDS